jgi:hypothetical protein
MQCSPAVPVQVPHLILFIVKCVITYKSVVTEPRLMKSVIVVGSCTGQTTFLLLYMHAVLSIRCVFPEGQSTVLLLS